MVGVRFPINPRPTLAIQRTLNNPRSQNGSPDCAMSQAFHNWRHGFSEFQQQMPVIGRFRSSTVLFPAFWIWKTPHDESGRRTPGRGVHGATAQMIRQGDGVHIVVSHFMAVNLIPILELLRTIFVPYRSSNCQRQRLGAMSATL
jgi:hypothetical protein